MKVLVLSDLHLELASFAVPAGLDYDAVILAGDIHSPGHRAVHWARRESIFGTEKPILFVPGNHEYYNVELSTELQQMRAAAPQGTNIVVLDRDEVVIGKSLMTTNTPVRVLGCTLWTDFALPVLDANGYSEQDVGWALDVANRRVRDFDCISLDFGRPSDRERRRRLLTAEDTLARHWVDRSWLQRKLAEPFDGKTVVVTHHSPSRLSVAPKYAGDRLTPAFVSDLPAEFFEVPTLWVHGHTHWPVDAQIGRCRLISNPRGYRIKDGSFENQHFDPKLIIEV
jgi:predicted phosphodiesterase